MTATLRVTPSGDGIILRALKAGSKSFVDKGQVGRFEPQAAMHKYSGLPESVVLAFIAETDPEKRAEILKDRTFTETESNVPLTARDFEGWLRLAGDRKLAGRMLAQGIVAIPDAVPSTDDAIDAMLALAGLDASTFESESDESDEESDESEASAEVESAPESTDPEPSVKRAK